ncbi:alpha/beta fold hydrolase [Streptomyces sp. NPDC058008]|uniref:alpha/beta fold hydrolase n=1 Tax=Streptomyces sp. NPDC058008 TaxID=3346303 RepID=UPI0036EF55C9
MAGQRTHAQDVVDEVTRLDPRDVVLVGHGYSGIPVGQAAERIGDRPTRVVLADSDVPVDGRLQGARGVRVGARGERRLPGTP